MERLLNEAATVISTYAVDQNIDLGKLINFGRLASLPHEEQLAGDYMAAVKVTLEAFLANGNLSLSPLFIKSYLEADLAMFINGGGKNLLEGLIKDLKQIRDKAKEGGVVVAVARGFSPRCDCPKRGLKHRATLDPEPSVLISIHFDHVRDDFGNLEIGHRESGI